MKRALSILLFMLIIAPVVLADGGTYYFEQFDMEVITPAGFTVITRDTPEGDPAFSELGLVYTVFLSNMIESRTVLSAIRQTPHSQLTVSGWKDGGAEDTKSYNDLSDTELNALANAIMEAGETGAEVGLAYTGYSIYTSDDRVYIMFNIEGEAEGVPLSGRQYRTVQNGMCIVFGMVSRTQTFSAADADILREMVDKTEYTTRARSARTKLIGNMALILGMFAIGAATMISANKRSKQLKAQMAQKKKDWQERSKARPAYCPACGAKMESAAFCTSCGRRFGFYDKG